MSQAAGVHFGARRLPDHAIIIIHNIESFFHPCAGFRPKKSPPKVRGAFRFIVTN